MAMAQSPNNNLAVSVAFDDKSGNALVVYQNTAGSGSTQTQLQYQTFNGTAWAAPVSFYTDTQPAVTTTLTSNPYSDQVMLMVNDHNMILKADLWSGTSFATPIQLETNTNFNQGQPFTFAWDSSLPNTATVTFTQTTPMALPYVLPTGKAVTVTTYIQVTSGTLPASPNITARLSYAGGTIVTLPAPPMVTSLGGGFYKLVWTGTVANNVTVPTGGQIALTYTANDSNYAFNILYDSKTYPSQVQMATATGIMVTSLAVYNAPYSGGSPITTTPAGQPAYVRFTLTDPFGTSDITSADVVIKNSSGGTVLTTTLTDTSVVASSAGSKTYQLAWTPMTADTYTINVTAHEGTEGVTATGQTTITATGAPDLVVTKSDGGATVNAGGTVAYTINYSNAGFANSTGVVLTEFLPVGSTFNAAASTPGWTAVGTTAFTFKVGSVPVGASGSVVFAVSVPAPVPTGERQLTNTVNIADDGTHGPDANPSNNSASDTTPINAGPDLVVTKTDGGVTTLPGGIVLYQIAYSNIGTANDAGVVIEENISANTTFNSTYSDPRWGNDGVGIFEMVIGDLPVGASGTVLFAVNMNSPLPPGTTQIPNTVTIEDSGASGPDLNPANNTFTISTPVAANPQADLQITKTDNITTITPGTFDTYTITVTNAGPNAVTGASFTDNVPALLSGVAYTTSVSGGASVTPGSGSGNNITGSLNVPVGGTVIYTVTGKLDPNAGPGTLTNIASVYPPAGTTDPNIGNNTAIDQDNIVPVSDLAMSKSFTFTDLDGSGTLTPGDQIVFALTVTNNGPNPAQGVSVLDPLPTGYQYVSDDAKINGGTYATGTGLWTIGGTIGATAPNNTAVLHITAIVGSGGNYTNAANINTSNSSDPNPGNNTASVTPPVQPKSDLSLAKTMALTKDNFGTGVISIGDQVTFTITLNNSGPNAATGVHVADLLPAGYAFVSFTASQGTYTSTTGDWNVGTVNVLSPQTLSIVATVVANQPNSAYTNTAQVSASGSFDPTPADDKASVTPFIADLSLTKTAALAPGGDLDNSGTLTVGDLVVFTVTVSNAGPDFATGVQVGDPLTAGFTYVSDDSNGNYNPSTGVWTVGAIAPGLTQTLNITVQVNASGPYTNTAQVTASDQFDPNSTPNNNVPTEDDQATVTLTPGAALTDLAVTKTVSNPTPNVGDTVTFTVTLTNIGPTTATGVTVQDSLPTGLTFVSATPSLGTYNSATGVWTVGTVTTTTPQTLTIQAKVVGPTPLTNAAAISHLDQFDSNASNNTASATETPQQADLALTKTASNPTPLVGDTVTFTVTLNNAGPDTATNVRINDLLPSGLSFVSAAPSQGSYDNSTGVWTVGSVATSAAPVLTLTARVNSPNALTNTATIGHSDQFDPNTSNNSANATETPQQADLALAKIVSDPAPNVGDTITFTVSLRDLGPNTATNVQVTDLLPAGLTFVSATPSQGSYNSATGLWSVGTVATGLVPTLTITAKVVSSSLQTNTASISHSDQFDPDPGNNQASATETPQQADLQVQKAVDHSHPNVGDTITYTVTLSNVGPDTATHAQVTDLLPAGLAFVGATPSQGTYSSTTGVWNVGTVANGAVATLLIQAKVNSPNPQFNAATASQADQFDPDTGNNTGGVLETPQQADLAVGKSVSNPTPNVGDTITYTIHLTNNGPDAATSVTVQDVLPAGVSYRSSSATAGTFDPNTRTWTVGAVAVGTTQTLTITATVVGPNPLSNTATISHSDQFDPNTANNGDTASINPQHADLQLGKTVSNPTPNVGDTVTFTLTLTDNGPNAATNVTVQDLLPAGLTFVSATPSQGTYSSTTGVWTIGTVTMTTPQTLIIQARVTSPAVQTNTATISHSDQFDPDPGNNSASATETPQQADLALAKSVTNPTPNVGDTVTFTVTLTDLGPNAASGVAVQDLLPAGLTLLSFSPSRGTYTPATGVWNVGAIDPSAAQTLTLSARVVSPAAQTNTATISHSDQFDPVNTNNTASVTETPQQADLAITKAVSDATPNVGDTITFTVTLRNNGPDTATNVTVNDGLPAGLTVISATPSQGTYTGGVWTVGTVGLSVAPTLALIVRVDSPNPDTNTATISHADQFDPDTSNNTASATETPQQADLALTKTVNNPTPNVGDTVTFTVTLTNFGPNTASSVAVTDLLPAGLQFVSDTTSQGTYQPTNGKWTVGTVTVAAPQTLTLVARVVSPLQQTNTATITHTNTFDPNPSNDEADATVTPGQADLALTKSVSNPKPNVGDTITFTVTLSDKGPNVATNVTVQDLLPAGLTFVSATPSQGTYSSTSGVWTVGTVTTATPQTLQILATVVSPSAQTNTATISHADQFDPNTGNNSADATETPQQADLQVNKTVSNPTPNVGDTITYTITLKDNGPDSATNVTLTDLLPAGVAFVSATASQGTYTPGTGVWTVGTVAVTTPQTLTITATVTSPNPAANTAAISHSDQFDPNTANNSDTASTNPQQADLALAKTVSNARPNVGDTITFTVTLTDNGPNTATNVTVQDLLPAGLTFVSATPSQGTYVAATGVWTVGTVTTTTAQTLQIQAMIASPSARTNTATITHADQSDPNSGNNSASATETPQQADLALTKSVSNATPNVGDTVTFTVTLNDKGPDPATNVTVQDLLPAGLTFVSATPSQGGYNNATGVWTVGTVTTTSPQTLLIRATVTSPGPQTNTASISHSDQFDPVTTNNSGSVTETPQQADLALAKTVSNPAPNVGDTITFTVTLINNGPDAATGVTINEPIPAGLSFVSATASIGSYNSGTGLWTVGTVSNGTSAVLNVSVLVVSPAAQSDTASISHSDQFDPVTTNNSASATETPQQADLQVSKTVSNPTPNVGDTITFTVTLTDNGPNAAANVTVHDLLPVGVTFLTATPSQGTYADATGTWEVGTVTPGGPQTLQIQARVNSPNAQTNTATVARADQFDPNTANNTASATETPQQADLAVTKTVSNARPNVGDTITFTVTLTDKGPGAANGVEVSDLLPAGLTFVSAVPSQGSYDPTSGLWTVGTVSPANPVTLALLARVASPDLQTNTATIKHADQFDPDPGNNQASATETPQQADLALSKTVSNPKPNVGDTITYTVTLTNAGPDAATNAQVTDLLPAGLAFVGAAPSQGTYNSTTGLWNVGAVANGAVATLQIQAKVNSPSAQLNTATISHADQFDPDTGNNSGGALETPQQADLAVGKSVSNPTPNVGDTITYTVRVTDNGPDAATGVTVQDVLPAGVSYQSSSATAGIFDPATRTWTVGTVATGATQTLTITATVVSPNPQTNTATISHADQFDPNTANNGDTASVTPQQADLQLGKVVSNPTPNVGDTVTFTLTLTDNGPNAATNVTVQDLLPAGLTFVSATPSQGTYSSATGVWTVGTVTITTAQTLAIQARVTSPAVQTNTATISHSDQFDPDPGNNSASATETPQQADLALAKSVSNPTPNVGDIVAFALVLGDKGPNAATNVQVTDLLPAGLTFVSATPSQGTYDGTSGVWAVGTVTTAAAQTLVIRARVVSPSAQTNTATISHSDQFDPVTTNNSASVTETPQQADLAVTKTVSNATPNVGDTVTFTVTLTDNGPDPATGVQLTDLLPAGLALVSATESQGTYDSATGLWTVGQVGTTGAATLTLQARVVSPAAQTNTATISHSDQFDPVSTNNSGSATETPQQADLTLTKTVSNATPNVGDTITFTVTLTDKGPNPATGVQVTDLLPAGLTFVSALPSQGSYNPTSGLWTVGTVDTTSARTLTLTARVVSSGPTTNTATVSHSDQFDPNTGDNTASVTETPQQADLQVSKTVSNATPNVGDTITFTVTLSDSGPNAATNVTVQDLLPAGLTFVSATPSQGSYNSASGVWTVGTVTTTTPQTLLIQATVASPVAQTNTATISHSDQFDPNAGNNGASATETPQQADLQVRKTVSNPTPNVGDTITYTITLTDNGPDPATSVTLTDLLPAGVAFVSATPSQGTYNSGTGVWTVGTVAVTTPQTLTITATVTSANPGANTAAISHADQFDPNTANNSDTASTNPQQADLAVSKMVSNPRPNVGDTITFTVTLTDTGPSAATNVTVQDLLPAGLTFVAATPSQGTYVAATGVWTVGTVTTSTAQTLQIQAKVVSPNAQANTASISHSDQFDPDPGNNTGTATETPQQADLALTKSVSNATPNVGDTITFTMTLTDKGPDPATNVTVQDLLPAGLTFVSATPSQGTYNSTTGAWTVGTITTTTAQTLLIQARVTSPVAQTNVATISHSDQFDPDPRNNNPPGVTETPQQANLAVAKAVSNARPNVGDTITFTVTLSNSGPDAATNVSVTDLLPAGLSFVAATPSQGTYNSITGVWTVNTVDPSTTATLQLQARVVSPVAQTNVATVSHADQFDPDPTNNTGTITETPQQADLQVSKTVSNATPNVGDTVTFTVTLKDNGPDPATNVTVQDLLPGGLTFISATPSQGSYSSATGAWAVGTVTTAAPQTLQIQARVDSPGARTNAATVSAADQFDPNTANNSASATETPQQADLAVAKTVSNARPNVGDTITFTVTLTDKGPGAASAVTVSDSLPPGLSFVSFRASQGSYDSGTGLWAVGDIAANAPQTLQINARVDSPVAQTNIAAISHSDQFDPDPTNNIASTTETPQQADLALTKSVSNAKPNMGDTITFTATLTNNGPDAATNVTVNDLLPGGLTFVSATPSQGTYSSTTGLWTVGTVPAAAPETLTIQAKVVSPGQETNTATITHADQFDPNPGNNTAGASETPQQADLAVTKTVSDPTPNVGDTITYTITLSDNGPDPGTGVTVQDTLPAGVSFVSALATEGGYNPATGIWTVGTVVVGAPQTLTITATVVSPNPAANTATISHADQFDPNPGNNSGTASTNPQQADLAVSKTVSNPHPNVGDTITFTVTLTDSGPSEATGVQVTDLLPVGLTLVSATPSQGSYSSATGLWNVGAVASGGQAVLTLQATVVSPNPQTNTATVSHADQFDPNPANNTGSATETPQQADLQMSKSVSNATPNVGDTVTFTVTLRDLGPDAATNVTVNDLLPAGLTLVSATPSQGTYNSTAGVWTVGTVDLSAARTLTLTASVVSPQAQTNTASVSHSDQFDPNAGNNTASATETPQQADLALAKTVSNPTPNVGDTITFTVTLANKGPDAATNVAVNDLLPAGLTFVTATPSLGSYNSGTGLWSVGTLAGGTNATLTIGARVVSPGAQINTATISHSDQFDPDTTNNTASTTETPQQADLALAKSVSNPTPNVSDTITFIVTLTDNGPNAATGVTVTDPLPAGLDLLAATPSQGSYNPITGVWSVGTVNPGAPQTLQFQAKVVSAGAQTNTATITHADQFDPDGTNNQASATETPQQADLALTKTVSNARPNVGDTITFTVTLTDNGPNAASNVAVQDLLPAGLTFVSATPSQGTYNSTTGVWAVGTVTAATPQTLTIQARVGSPNAQTNTATISHSDQFDPDPGNNTAAATETPQQADLQVRKTVSNPTPNVGDTITYTITLSDNGPDSATSVTVQDTLPAGVSFVSATPSQGSYNSTTGVWTVGTVTTTIAQTLLIQATVVSPSPGTNTAAVKHADQFDPNLANNSDTASTNPQQADLAVSKTVSNAHPNVGDTITFTVTLTNSGPNTATNVTVSDPLPPGLQFVSATPSQGTYNSSTGLWTVGTVTAAAPQTLQIQAKVISQDAQSNAAAISHADQFDPDPGNNTGIATETPQQADLALTKSVSNATPNVGDIITFTMALTDKGPDPATNVTVQDLLPAGLTFVSATPSQGTYVPGTGVWTVGTITTTTAQTLLIQARVTSPVAQTNVATISHSDQFDPDPTNNNPPGVTETPQQADLALTKAVSNARPNVGDTITFTVTLTNSGPDAATNVSVTDLLPGGLSFVAATPSQGTYNSTTGVWTVNTVDPSTTATLQLQARVVSSVAQTNVATVNHADQFDPDPTNNTGTVTETPQQADLALTKSVSNATPNVGDIITFTMTLTDKGPDAATNVTVQDLLPAGLTFVSAAPSQGTYNSATGVWAVGTVTTATPQTLLIQARVASPVAQTNVATISHSDQFDPDPTNNNPPGVTETPQQADLALIKMVSNPTPNVGDTITFTMTLTDKGPNPATNVTVQDLLPAGLTFVSATPSQGTYNSATGVWAVGTVTTAIPQTLLIQARVVSPAAQTNVATISHADQFDPNAGDNTGTATETPQVADLAITKTVSNSSPNLGDTITFTVTLTNIGPSGASGVQVTDPLPPGLTLVSSNTSQGSYASATGLWTVGSLAKGAQATLTLTAQVVSILTQTNTATITHADQFDPVPGNNSAGATETPQQADLVLTKTVNNNRPNFGDVVTFTVTLTDKGPGAATNVSVADALPAGLTLVSATPSQGTYAAGVWTVGTVTTIAPQTLTLTARVVSPDAQTNTATISAADQFDPDPSNNGAPSTVTPQQADLTLTKVADQTQVMFGLNVTFTVTLANRGPGVATDVIVDDPLPPGLAFVSAISSQGPFAADTGMWMVGTLGSGAVATLHVTARIAAIGPIVNSVEAAALQFDPNLSNNVATATVTGTNPASIISKRGFLSSSDPPPAAGDPPPLPALGALHADIVLTNDVYQDILRRDVDPAGLAYWVNFLLGGGSVSDTPELVGLQWAPYYRTLSPTTAMGFILNGATPGDGVAPQTYTQRNVAGPLNLNGIALLVTHVPTDPTVGDTFTIIHTTGGVAGTFAGLPEGAIVTAQDGSPFRISYRANGRHDVTLTAVTPGGFSYDASSHTLTVSAGGAPFQYSQGSMVDSSGTLHTTYDFALNGRTIAYPDAQVAHVIVNGQGSNSAALITNDTYVGRDGRLHETRESAWMRSGGGVLYKHDAAGNAISLLQLDGFAAGYAYLGREDFGVISGTAGRRNTLVSGGTSALGSYSYMKTDDMLTSFIEGGAYVYAYAAGPNDIAYLYDGDGPSALVMSGTAYSYMTGTNHGLSFFNEAVGFKTTIGIAQHPGQDTAYFFDSPRDDVFAGYSAYSYMYSTNADGSLAEYNAAIGFWQVYASSFVGGTDYAYNYDPNHVHTNGFIRLK
jgi:uncharacterized repeat protein (TIGR01451 family)